MCIEIFEFNTLFFDVIYHLVMVDDIVDVACPGDVNIHTKVQEKVEKYQEITREIRKMCKVKTKGCTHCNWCPWHSTSKVENILKRH